MKRKYEQNLLSWLRDPNRKPLLILGARQVGKTYLVKDLFAEEYFPNDNHIYIDLSDDKAMREVISDSSSEMVLEYISRRYNKKLGKDTLLIFDEAQTTLGIVSLLKPFCENHREIPIIVMGSLVTLSLNRQKGRNKQNSSSNRLYPVGKINTLHVASLNFGEYLLNANPLLEEDLRRCYKEKKPLPDHLFSLANASFYDYLSIGGMPEVLDNYLTSKDYVESRRILDDIYNNYIGDMSFNQKSSESLLRTRSIYENIVTMLERESKVFHPSLIEKDKRTRDFLSPLEWLSLSETVLISRQVKEKVTWPLRSEEGSPFRLYLSDIGMFIHQAHMRGEEFLKADSSSISGVYFENYVAAEANSVSLPLYYWKGKKSAEFEFLLEIGGEIVPLEVKKSNGAPRSLEKYDAHNKRKLCLKLANGNLGYDQSKRLLTLPLFMAYLLFEDIVRPTTRIEDLLPR